MSNGNELSVGARSAKSLRKVTLLSLNTEIKIDPSAWRGRLSAKKFDDKSTAILRVFEHTRRVMDQRTTRLRRVSENKFMVYGMRAQVPDGDTKAKIIAEVYDIVADESLIQAAVAKVAAHCGIEPLVAELA